MLFSILGMDAPPQEKLATIIGYILAIFIAMSFHEFAHAYIAYKQGDDTARLKGRLTLNPLAHLDLFGTIALMIFGIGWAKPVPINPLHFKQQRKGIIWVSLAGVITNIAIAIISVGGWVLVNLTLAAYLNSTGPMFVLSWILNVFFFYGIFINVAFCIFNLIPVPPLDGFNVLQMLLPRDNKYVEFASRNSRWLFLAVLIFLNFTGFFEIVVDFISDKLFILWGII